LGAILNRAKVPGSQERPGLGKTMAKPRIVRLWFVTLAEKEPIERKSYYEKLPGSFRKLWEASGSFREDSGSSGKGTEFQILGSYLNRKGVFGGGREGDGVRSGPGAARTILLFQIISARPSKQPLMVRTCLKVYGA
jgi:hypothetical protein